jgi:hypothetical protein
MHYPILEETTLHAKSLSKPTIETSKLAFKERALLLWQYRPIYNILFPPGGLLYSIPGAAPHLHYLVS